MACIIATSIDPFFEIATRAIAELTNQERYQIQYQKTSSIHRVKSANNENQLRYHNLNGLARRLGVCARICMADSAGMDPRLLYHVDNCYDRNLEEPRNFNSELMIGEAQNLELDGRQKRKYCSEYDRLYSLHAIEEHIKGDRGRNNAGMVRSSIPSMMYIFRNNWSEVIQISTTMFIEDRGEEFENAIENRNDGRYNCRIQVVTIKANITEGRDQKFMRFLVALSNEHGRQNSQNLQNQDEGEDLAHQLEQLAINNKDLANLLVDIE